MELTYYEMRFAIILKEDLDSKNVFEKISKGINYCLLLNEKTKELHRSKEFKNYCFYLRQMTPLKTGQDAILIVRCAGKELKELLKEALFYRENNVFFANRIISDEEIKYQPQYMKRIALKTVNPAVIMTNGDQYLKPDANKELIIQALSHNIIKKYNSICGENIGLDTPVIEDVATLNKKPLCSNYKAGKIMGNKYIIKFHDDDIAQRMAFLMMATGAGTRNSLGFGATFANNDYQYQMRKAQLCM